MTEYDAFGRPIYETAEEYNRAKENQIPQNKMVQEETVLDDSKNTKKVMKVMIVVIGLTIAIQLVVVGGLMFNYTPESDYNVEEEFLEDWVDYDEGNTTNPLPYGFENFFYNGQSCTLPVLLEDILNMGFSMEVYERETVFAEEWEEMVDLYDASGNVNVIVRVKNPTNDKMPIGKCEVNYFSIENPLAYHPDANALDFEFADGLTFESTYAQVEAYFGTPCFHYEDYSEEESFYDNYQWAYYGDDEIHFVSIIFWNGVIDNVSIEKKAYEEKY